MKEKAHDHPVNSDAHELIFYDLKRVTGSKGPSALFSAVMPR